VLKVQYLSDTSVLSKKVDGPTDQELMKMFSTSKYEWKYTYVFKKYYVPFQCIKGAFSHNNNQRVAEKHVFCHIQERLVYFLKPTRLFGYDVVWTFTKQKDCKQQSCTICLCTSSVHSMGDSAMITIDQNHQNTTSIRN